MKFDYRFRAVIDFYKEPNQELINEFIPYFYDLDYHYDKNTLIVTHRTNSPGYVHGYNDLLFDFLRTYLDRAIITIHLFDSLVNPTIFELIRMEPSEPTGHNVIGIYERMVND